MDALNDGRGFEDDVRPVSYGAAPARPERPVGRTVPVRPWVTAVTAAAALRSRREARRIPFPDKVTEREWLRAWQSTGDETALSNLLFGCLIAKIWARAEWVSRFRPDEQVRLEIVSEGFAAVRIAADKFDLDQDVRFHTYAQWHVKAVVDTAYGKLCRTIKLPHQYRYGGAPEGSARCVASTDQPVSADEPGSSSLGETLMDPDASADHAVDTARDMAVVRERLGEAMTVLKDRERDVLSRRYGLDGRDKQTLEEVGDLYGVTRERVRQIEKASLGKLAVALRGLPLTDLLEGIEGVTA